MTKPLVHVAAGIIRNEFGQIYVTQRLEGQEFCPSIGVSRWKSGRWRKSGTSVKT